MSNYQIISDSDKIKTKVWEQFVLNHPQGGIYQTPFMYNVYKKTKNYHPLLIQAFQIDKLVGTLLAIVIKEKEGLTGKLTSRAIINGGPLVKNNNVDLVKGLIIEYEKFLNNKAIYTEIREVYELPFKNVLKESGYDEEKRVNILIDLTKDEDALWSDVNSKRRNEIRRAEKEGTQVKEITIKEEVEESFKILKEVYQRAKLPLADKSLFTKCFDYLFPAKMIKYIGAYFEGKLIGTMYILCYKERAIDWYAGSYKAYYNKYPNDLIPWEAIKILKREGYKVFDFGGAGKPDVPYGVRDYKKKFGGDLIELKRYQKIHKPLLMQTGKLGLKLWHKLK